MERLGCWSNRRRAAGAPTDALLTNGEFSLSCGGGGKVAVRSLILPILCLRSSGTRHAQRFSTLLYIPQDMCELVCALSIQQCTSAPNSSKRAIRGEQLFILFYIARWNPKWRVTFHCRGRRRKASLGPSRGSENGATGISARCRHRAFTTMRPWQLNGDRG